MNARKKAKQLKKINKELQEYKKLFEVEQICGSIKKSYETEVNRICAGVRIDKETYNNLKSKGNIDEVIRDRLAQQFNEHIYKNIRVEEKTDEYNEIKYKNYFAEIYVGF